jgi:hypothetical protein
MAGEMKSLPDLGRQWSENLEAGIFGGIRNTLSAAMSSAHALFLRYGIVTFSKDIYPRFQSATLTSCRGFLRPPLGGEESFDLRGWL